MADDVTLDEVLLELLKIETQMDRVGGWNLRERWKSGRYLLSRRSRESGYLPKGQLATVAATLKVSRSELSDRMRVADAYRTDTEFTKAARGRTWTDLLRSLPKTREARNQLPTHPPRDWRRQLYEALGHTLAGNLLGDPMMRTYAQKLYDHLGGYDDDVDDQDQDQG